MSRERAAYRVGDRVTVAEMQPGDPYILSFQYHVHIAEVIESALPGSEPGYVIRLDCLTPPNLFGPYPAERFVPGWDHDR